MNSIQYDIEDAIADLLSSTGNVNIYKTNRIGARKFPYITIEAEISQQMLGSYTGVYGFSVTLNYADSAIKITQSNFDEKYSDIFNILYNDTATLSEKLQSYSESVKFYSANISNQTPTIKATNRSWQKGLKLNLIATYQYRAYAPSLDFSDERNSMYIPAI